MAAVFGRDPDEVYQDEKGRCDYWFEFERLAAFSVQGHATRELVEWVIARQQKVLQRNLLQGRRMYLAWDLFDQSRHDPGTRRPLVSWYIKNSKHITRFVRLVSPAPLVRMAIVASDTFIGKSGFLFMEPDEFIEALTSTCDYLREKKASS
ncbi:MAG: hypothetical protein AAF658_06215 [Myxococcota bacterium]